jgi:hypothetical protein
MNILSEFSKFSKLELYNSFNIKRVNRKITYSTTQITNDAFELHEFKTLIIYYTQHMKGYDLKVTKIKWPYKNLS